jgi:hypothetical protein
MERAFKTESISGRVRGILSEPDGQKTMTKRQGCCELVVAIPISDA